jgi:hypothetical protein
MPQQQHLHAERIVSAGRRGSSRPIVVETSLGTRLVKLRGAGQGTGPLVAEIIVAELAEALGLNVPPRSLITLSPGIPTADWDQELADLLRFSTGMNLGFDYLPGAREVTSDEARAIPVDTRIAVLWLDRFVMNHDRTVRNPHILYWSETYWFIDHGASLGFQYRWSEVTEDSPRGKWVTHEEHVFDKYVTTEDLARADAALAMQLTRTVLENAVRAVPDDFIVPLINGDVDRVERRRAAYVAYLWKRLRGPRSFLNTAELRAAPTRGKPPSWLTGKRS